MFVQSMKNLQLHIALECTSPLQAQRRLLNLSNYLKAILNVILLYLQTETQITRSYQSLNQQNQRILSGICSIYQIEKKRTPTSRIVILCVRCLQSLYKISHLCFTKTLQSRQQTISQEGSYYVIHSCFPLHSPHKRQHQDLNSGLIKSKFLGQMQLRLVPMCEILE